MSSFENRHVLVTGASTGMGRATAVMLVQRGARVSLVARTQANLDSAYFFIRAALPAMTGTTSSGSPVWMFFASEVLTRTGVFPVMS